MKTEYPKPGQNLARDRVWGSFPTGGSQGIRGSHEYVREGGALAREMLREAAAEAWDVPVEECTVASSLITHRPTGRTTTYGKVAAAAAKLVPPFEVELKDPKEWKLIGKPVKRLETLDKLTGKQVFVADLQLPGLLNASIKACSVFDGSLSTFRWTADRCEVWCPTQNGKAALAATAEAAGLPASRCEVYMECFFDELARAAGVDPLEFRRKRRADHPKSLAVL